MNENYFENSLQQFNESRSNFEYHRQRYPKESGKRNGAGYKNYCYWISMIDQ